MLLRKEADVAFINFSCGSVIKFCISLSTKLLIRKDILLWMLPIKSVT